MCVLYTIYVFKDIALARATQPTAKPVGARQPPGPKRTPFKTPQSSATKKNKKVCYFAVLTVARCSSVVASPGYLYCTCRRRAARPSATAASSPNELSIGPCLQTAEDKKRRKEAMLKRMGLMPVSPPASSGADSDEVTEAEYERRWM